MNRGWRWSSVLGAIALGAVAPLISVAQAQESVRLTPGMVITRSVRIAPGTYRLPAPASLDSALVVIRGNDITVDLSFHQNEQREWMRFGAAIYLEDVTGGTIRGNRAEQGMNGLLMTRTDSVLVHDNVFAFNSGLGIGMYRASWNRIVRNRIDYNVRGYSHGWYRRGQDSAGLLMYEQSHHNSVSFNSVTHSGDGLFLWAGQQTMDSGEGGANDNTYFANDFSFAPTNGIEATFSRNAFYGNRVEGNDHGVWGGYSYQTTLLGNCFADNRVAIAIEHGQQNAIARNRDYQIRGNTFSGHRTTWRVTDTSPLDTANNPEADLPCDPRERMGSVYDSLATWALAGTGHTDRRADARIPVAPWPRRDRSAIIVDEWGPFDWRSPKLRVISDNAARVWVDGQLVLERRLPGGSELMHAPILPGRHAVRVAFYQLKGWTELRVEMVPGSDRSVGSAGPH